MHGDDKQPQDCSADYAATLNDLAQLRLSEGKVEEAQQLFRQALDVQQKLAASPAQPGESAEEDLEDDWETRWDSGAALEPSPQAESSEGWGKPTPRAPAAASQTSRRAAGTAGGSSSKRSAAAAAAALPPSGSPQGAAAAGDEVPFGGAHVLEIFDLSTAVKTAHLEQFLASLQPSSDVPPVLKWVDDYRALALFANPRVAQSAMQAAASLEPSAAQPVFSVRPFADASALSRATPATELQPPKPRPVTTAAVARRLIGGALNLKLRDREEEQVLATARRDLKAAAAQRREKLDEAWGDE